jgi:hypothetical protein
MANQASAEAAEAAAARAEASTALQRIGALEARMQARPPRGRRDCVRRDMATCGVTCLPEHASLARKGPAGRWAADRCGVRSRAVCLAIVGRRLTWLGHGSALCCMRSQTLLF